MTTSAGPAARTRIVLRPLGSSLPLGFFAFGVGVLLTGLLDLRALPTTDTSQVAVLLLTFPAPLELLACVLAYLARDAGAATAMGVFGASWVSTGTGLLLAEPGSRSSVTGVFSLALAAVLLSLAVAAAAAKPALTVLLSLATARAACEGLYDLTGTRGLQTAAGVVALLVVVVACTAGWRCCSRTPAAIWCCPQAAAGGRARRSRAASARNWSRWSPRRACATSSEPWARRPGS